MSQQFQLVQERFSTAVPRSKDDAVIKVPQSQKLAYTLIYFSEEMPGTKPSNLHERQIGLGLQPPTLAASPVSILASPSGSAKSACQRIQLAACGCT